MFIYNYLIEIMKEQVADKKFLELTDFFELLEYAAMGKVWILDKNLHIADFTMRAFYLKKNVSDDLKSVNTKQEEIMYQTYFDI